MFNHHLIKRSLASGLVIAAAGFPASAQAMWANGGGSVPSAAPVAASSNSGGNSSAQRQLDQLHNNVQRWFAVHGRFPSSVDSTAPASIAPTKLSGGFRWRDAGIGAAGAVALLGAGALGARATRRRRRPVVG